MWRSPHPSPESHYPYMLTQGYQRTRLVAKRALKFSLCACPFTVLVSPGRCASFASGHDPLKQMETPSFGKCLHLSAWSDMMSNFFNRSLQLFVALLQSPVHGGMGFWVPLQGGAKTEHRKGSKEEEHPALTSGASLLATAIASSWDWWFSRFGNCTELYGTFLHSGILIGSHWPVEWS